MTDSAMFTDAPAAHAISQAERDYNAQFASRLPDILRKRELQRWCDGIDAMWSKFAQIAPEFEIAPIQEPEDWQRHPEKHIEVFYEQRCDPAITNDPRNITTCVYSPGYGQDWHRVSFYPVWSTVRGEPARMMREITGSRQALSVDETINFVNLKNCA